MSDWLEELTQKLVGTNKNKELITRRDPKKATLIINEIFAKDSFLRPYQVEFLSAQQSGLEGMGHNPCYARIEVNGIADGAHLFIPYDDLIHLCAHSFGDTASQDMDFLNAFLKFFLVEVLLNLQQHPFLMGKSASILECHVGIPLEHFKTFNPSSALDFMCSTEGGSVRLPMRLVFSPAFEKSWQENWEKGEGVQREYLDYLKTLPVTLHLHAAFAELSQSDVSHLSVGDWIVLEKVGFEASHDWVTVMIFSEGIQIGVGTFDGKELTVQDLAPSSKYQILQGKKTPQNQ